MLIPWRMKRAIALVMPPLVVSGLERLRRIGRNDGALPEWEAIPEGWAYADAHPEVKGWNVHDVLNTYRRKWPRFSAMTRGTGPLGVSHESELTTREDLSAQNTVLVFAYSLALAAQGRQSISMLDWGGGIGHYNVLARAFLPGTKIEYHCKDVQILVDMGRELFPDCHFYADDGCLRREYEFVLASTSLHYTPDWRAVLGGLARAASSHLLVTRLPMANATASYVFLQRAYVYGYNTEYLGWCLNRDEFLTACHENGLEVVREFVIGEQIAIAGVEETCRYRAFLLRRVGPARRV